MNSNYKILKFTADTVDGRILEFPERFELKCSLIRPQGVQEVRNYTSTECIEVIRVFTIYYDGHLFGSKCWKTFASFMRYYRAICQSEGVGSLCLNGEPLLINGCTFNI